MHARERATEVAVFGWNFIFVDAAAPDSLKPAITELHSFIVVACMWMRAELLLSTAFKRLERQAEGPISLHVQILADELERVLRANGVCQPANEEQDPEDALERGQRHAMGRKLARFPPPPRPLQVREFVGEARLRRRSI